MFKKPCPSGGVIDDRVGITSRKQGFISQPRGVDESFGYVSKFGHPLLDVGTFGIELFALEYGVEYPEVRLSVATATR